MNNYEINSDTLAVIGDSENSLIIEKDKEFTINLSTIKIIDNSCKFFGSTYKGRFDSAKNLIGISSKTPILIEESREIIFFPTASPRIKDCSWISLNNIKRYYKDNYNTIIEFNCGKVLKLDISYGIIDNQVLKSTKLRWIINKRKNILKNA